MKAESILKKLKPISIGSAMADLALLLLVFFMATTTTEPPKGVEVELPVAKTRGAEQDSLYVTIGRNGGLYLDGQQVSLQDFAETLDVRAAEKDHTVSITADKTLDYSQVSPVLNVLREKEFLNVVFMSQPKKEGP